MAETYSGKLFKKGETRRTWLPRDVSVEDGKLKIGKKACVATADISAVTDGDGAVGKKSKRSNIFSVITAARVYHFSAETEEDKDKWMKVLDGWKGTKASGKPVVTVAEKESPLSSKSFYAAEDIKELFNNADADKSGAIDQKELIKCFAAMEIQVTEKFIKKLFAEHAGKKKKGGLTLNQFTEIIENLEKRDSIVAMFNEINGGKKVSSKQFAKWLVDEQGEEDAMPESAAKIIAEVQSDSKDLTLVGFHRYLANGHTLNSAWDPKSITVHQDMSLPLGQYWMASSHNTYLLGDQLRGESAIEAYKNAFAKGCRCVELDCWDGPEDEPIIYHGHTLTSRIVFKDVIQATKDFGFVHSSYPIVLSLENHCSPPFQEKMVEHMTTILGDMLPPTFASQKLKDLPSPDALKNKVLIKGKTIKAQTANDAESEEEDNAEVPEEIKKKKKKKVKVIESLSNITHLSAVHFHSFDEPGECWEMSSFAEPKMEKLVKSSSSKWAAYNHRQLSRIYPKGLRVDSSNYEPIRPWCAGAQLVALNYQTGEKEMWWNDALFRDNGGCGLVLKPQSLCNVDAMFDPTAKLEVTKTLVVNVIGAFKLPYEKGGTEVVDPYVKLEVKGIAKDCQKSKTKVVNDDGFSPVWNHSASFPLRAPDYAFLLLHVWDSDVGTQDDYIAHNSIRINTIRSGTRSIPLCHKNGDVWPDASLLVHFSWK